MVFSSATFLFYFLPLTLALYYVALRIGLQLANLFLLLASLVFYFWGEREYLILFLASISVNYFAAWLLARTENPRARRLLFLVGVVLNLGALGFFKYAGFLSRSLLGDGAVSEFFTSLRLPLGISFFTFHGLSYLFDIYRGTIQFRPGKVNVALYIALFPQLIAGPIVRYKEISSQFEKRAHSWALFASGIERFIFGLAKKILIANELGAFADYAFALPPERLSGGTAWLGIVSYTLQIYFDFSGYSDMAIGLAQMFGFQFPENFRLPYTARSVREFWQRWHITLSNWFRDYLYIPLGGNRGGALQTSRNLCIVFLLCGLWHGASWNFVLWGICHGAFLSLERGWFGRWLESTNRVLQHVYVMGVVMLLWVPFRAETLRGSLDYYSALLGGGGGVDPYLVVRLKNQTILCLILGVLFASGVHRSIGERKWVRFAAMPVMFLLALSEIAAGSYSPFIYFRF